MEANVNMSPSTTKNETHTHKKKLFKELNIQNYNQKFSGKKNITIQYIIKHIP